MQEQVAELVSDRKALPHGSLISIDADHYITALSVEKTIDVGIVAWDLNNTCPATAGQSSNRNRGGLNFKLSK